jgi:hypothetical protein
MQYHQIIIFFHRPWLSKSYIQPRSPRQGPGYHHARRMCVESATVVARLLHLYEKHYTFRRMNNQVVAIIFSAALMLLFVTVSSSPMSPGKQGESPTYPRSAEMVAYLNLCFRALDELGQSFENAKRTRDYLVTLQRRWQAHMRRSGSATKRQISGANSASMSQQPSVQHGRAVHTQARDGSRKKSRLSLSDVPPHMQQSATAPPTHQPDFSHQNLPQYLQQQKPSYQQQQQHPFSVPAPQLGDLDWIRNSDMRLLSENQNPNASNGMRQIPSPSFPEDSKMLADLGDIDSWWGSPNGASGLGGSSL